MSICGLLFDVNAAAQNFVLDASTQPDPALQSSLEKIDSRLRNEFGMAAEQTAAGLLDLQTARVAMIRPDCEEYGASVPKIGILLAYFQLHPEAAAHLDPQIRHELGLMAKASSNEMASKFSQDMGLARIREALDAYQFYDPARGGIWVGKHYGLTIERVGSPMRDNSHGATIRQILRFYLLLEQGQLVSPAASRVMKEILESPQIPHDDIKFVQGLAGRGLHILRKWGSWEDWLHDTAIITGASRHYILAALTRHPRGDDYLTALASAADDLMIGRQGRLGEASGSGPY